MPQTVRQILRQRECGPDRWRYPGEEGGGPRVVALSELCGQVPGSAAPVAVRIGPADDVAVLRPFIPQLQLIVVAFEQNGDGRGFSQAQTLRQQYGFRGELRASGAIKRDHLFLLARCGFDAFDLDPSEDPTSALAHLQQFSVAYQGASGSLVQPRQRD